MHKIAMKHYLTSLLLVVSLALWAEDAPVWYNAASRASAYPSEIFVTGFAMQKVNSCESVEKAQEAVIEKARANAVSTIEVRIQNETEDRLQQLQYKGSDGTMNALQRYLQSVTRSSVDMEISGLKFEAYHDAANGRVAGFAYVKKTELIRQTDRKLTSTLSKIENGLDEMDELIRLGQKLQARQRGEKLAPLFVKAEDLQRLLIAVDPYADEESLQTEQLKSLQKRYIQAMAALKNGINIYLVCNASLCDGATYDALKKEVQGELSKMGCTFVTSPEQSDWDIKVVAKAREYRATTYGQYTNYSVYVDTQISITRTATGQLIFGDQLPEAETKGNHTVNYEQAARDAYKKISPKVSAIIKEQIQQ